jgi:hypothetical protein
MKLVMNLACRDEADILDAHLRFHLAQGVDHFIATANRSADEILSILEDYQRAGVLTLICQDRIAFEQDQWVNEMARTAWIVYNADWVMNSDADQFWWPVQGSLKDVLKRVPPGVATVHVPRRRFIPGQVDSGPFFDRMRILENRSQTASEDLLLSNACYRGAGAIDGACGNELVHDGDTALEQIDGSRLLEVLSFPVRSYEQLERKLTMGAAAFGDEAFIDSAIVAPWRGLLDEFDRGLFDEYYHCQRRDPVAIADGLRSGSLVKDDRLYDFFHERLALPCCAQTQLPARAKTV